MERIGIYGGTFNPPHLGHVGAARHGSAALGLSELLVIPSFISPHKKLPEGSATAQQRLEMLRLCFGTEANITVSDLEVQRGGTSYTYETLEQVKQRYPEKEIVLFMGTDMFLSLMSWKEPARIIKNAVIAVFYRGDPDEKAQIDAQKQALEKLGARIELVKNPVLAISSTDLRRMLVFRCAEAFLPPEVVAYIEEKGLYGVFRDLRGLSEKQLEDVVKGLLKPNRVTHVLGCRDTAVELARRWGADPTDAARAALLHDVTKALDGPLQLNLCSAYGAVLDDFSKENPKTLHALTGSLVARRIFGENDAVVAAIASHTTGKADMNVLEKIIYVADYMEPNRDFEGVQTLRSLAYSDLDGALELGLNMTLGMLRQQGREISGASLDALAWLEKIKKSPLKG